jgi:hypothetical protein
MQKLQQQILDWFKENARELPWRKTYAPYHVWISEIMLQQTQMDRVVDYFNRWVSRFPDLQSIAGASEEEVLKLWEGLGYYSRARNIIKSANILVAEYNGKLPADHKLPLTGSILWLMLILSVSLPGFSTLRNRLRTRKLMLLSGRRPGNCCPPAERVNSTRR